MDLKDLPLIDGKLPADEQKKRYVVLRATNGSGKPRLMLLVRPHTEHSDNSLKEIACRYPGVKFEKCAAGFIDKTEHGLRMHRGDKVYGIEIEAANLMRLTLKSPVATWSYEGGLLDAQPEMHQHAAE